jgi:galactosamine-6-phosphate isomerase
MKLLTFADYRTLCRAVADRVAAAVHQKPNALVCLASGHSPLGVFECLIEDVRAGRLDLSRCNWVGLDEWLGMNGRDPGSCRQMMDEFLFDPLRLPSSQIHFFDGRTTTPDQEVTRINNLIAANKGLDVMLVGIGTNGHIAMNEPGSSFAQHAHISQLAEETITVGQKYFKTPTPLHHGITLGLADFANARLPILMANGIRKAAIVKRLLQEKPNEQLPASIVHQMENALVMVDFEALPQ